MFFFVFLIFGFEDTFIAIMTLIAAAIHECGHIGYMYYLKGGGIKLRGVLSGFRMEMGLNTTYKEEIILCSLGPMVNIFTSVIFGLAAFLFGEKCALFSAVNLATALSNLLPIKGYDGYRMLNALFEEKNNQIMIKLLCGLSSSLIFIFCLFSLYLIDRYGTGYWIFGVFFISMIKSIGDDIS